MVTDLKTSNTLGSINGQPKEVTTESWSRKSLDFLYRSGRPKGQDFKTTTTKEERENKVEIS